MRDSPHTLRNLFGARKVGAAEIAVFMVLPLLPLTSKLALGPFLYVVSGRIFFSSFDRAHNGALDQTTMQTWFFLCTAYAVMTFPYMAIVRWISNRDTRWGYWAFAGPASIVCVYLLGTFTVPVYWLLQYIHAMGFTTRRIEGLVCGMMGYIVILAFLRWALRAPGQARSKLAAFAPVLQPDK